MLERTTQWAQQATLDHPDLLAVGIFGSYGRGDAGVGSDLDLLLVLSHCELQVWDRLRRWDTAALPLACDLLVYSLKEWQSLPQWNARLAAALRDDLRWLIVPPPESQGGSSIWPDSLATPAPQAATGTW